MFEKRNLRQAVEQLEKRLSRRTFLTTTIIGTGAAAVLDRFGERLFAATPDPFAVYSAIGNIIIPVDQDPGWKTFEPGISQFGLGVFVKQHLFTGDELAFQGTLGALIAMNEAPPLVNYGPRFLEMVEALQVQYFGDILSGQFEKDGVQDLIQLAAFLGLFSAKATFFSNFPNHLATPGAEFQVPRPSAVKTGWDIMGFKGPVGPDEEKALRARYFESPEIPGIDTRNPFL
ncbi:MAG TPA: hypothetical protein VGL91_24150 [Acidobacteriota bacterium]|jgi:hypothetical protein